MNIILMKCFHFLQAGGSGDDTNIVCNFWPLVNGVVNAGVVPVPKGFLPRMLETIVLS